MKIIYQGSPGAYSHLAALDVYPKADMIPCNTFEECFRLAKENDKNKIIIPVENSSTGYIGLESLIFKYRLNIYAEHFHRVKHNLLALPGVKLKDIKFIRSHAQAISQCQSIIKKYKLQVNIHADTAGSAKYISENKKENEAAISSTLSAKIYKLEIIKRNIEDEEGNITRFLIMGKKIEQPELKNKKYITSCLFKLKSKPAALYSALSGFAIQGVNLTKLQSYPEKNSFTSYFFLCDLDGHIEETKIQKSLEELGLHCEDFHVLGVYEADKFRNK